MNVYEFDAIGTHWWLERLDGKAFPLGLKVALQAYTKQFDEQYSRFRDDSLVASLARQGVVRNPASEFIDILEASRYWYDTTDGVLDPLVGNSLEELGYGNPIGRKNRRKITFTKDVLWDAKGVRVPKGVVLDFGGFGKGWLIDVYVKILRLNGIKQFIVNGGGDLYVQADEPVQFYLEHPYDPTMQIGGVPIQQGALAASSTVKRTWQHDGKDMHHIIDPETGQPSISDVIATFVLAETATQADACATALIIRPELDDKLRKALGIQTILLRKEQFETS